MPQELTHQDHMVVVTFRCPVELRKAVEDVANKRHISPGELTRHALRVQLSRYGISVQDRR